MQVPLMTVCSGDGGEDAPDPLEPDPPPDPEPRLGDGVLLGEPGLCASTVQEPESGWVQMTPPPPPTGSEPDAEANDPPSATGMMAAAVSAAARSAIRVSMCLPH